MNAPDKIYLHGYGFNDEPCKTWEREPKAKGMRGYPAQHVEYIRKDALLKWLESKYKETNGKDKALWRGLEIKELYDKINSI